MRTDHFRKGLEVLQHDPVQLPAKNLGGVDAVPPAKHMKQMQQRNKKQMTFRRWRLEAWEESEGANTGQISEDFWKLERGATTTKVFAKRRKHA